jgi:hypothetical protein
MILSFPDFLTKFPEIDLPVILSDETQRELVKINQPLSVELVRRFIGREDGVDPEDTEYIPCFRIKDTFEIHAIVYWRARLGEYSYHMATYSKSGKMIDRRQIGWTRYDSKGEIHQAITTIDHDWIISVAEGKHRGRSLYNPKSSKIWQMELLVTGEIVYSFNEELT